MADGMYRCVGCNFPLGYWIRPKKVVYTTCYPCAQFRDAVSKQFPQEKDKNV